MEDKEIVEEQLLVIKGVSDLYMHGVTEASTAEVHSAFKDALNETLNIQNKIYNLGGKDNEPGEPGREFCNIHNRLMYIIFCAILRVATCDY